MNKFPAPREVDKYLYKKGINLKKFYREFPAPLELDR